MRVRPGILSAALASPIFTLFFIFLLKKKTKKIIIDDSMPNYEHVQKLTTHSSVKVQCKIVKSPAKGQVVEG